MSVYCEFQKTSSDRSIFINSSQIIMVSYGSSSDTTTIELAGQRTFEVRGSVSENMSKLDQISG